MGLYCIGDVVMTGDEIATALGDRFGENVQPVPPDAWQVETDDWRLIAIASAPWIKLMTPIVPVAEAQSFLPQMMEANFDDTQEARYALHQEVIWGIFQYNAAALGIDQFNTAIDKLQKLKADGVTGFFTRMVESQVSKIITAAKLNGQSLEATLQTLDRFYSEGVMGNMGEVDSQKALEAWKYQLERLWPTVDVDKA